MGSLSGKLRFLVLLWQLVLEKENSDCEPVKFWLKTDLVS